MVKLDDSVVGPEALPDLVAGDDLAVSLDSARYSATTYTACTRLVLSCLEEVLISTASSRSERSAFSRHKRTRGAQIGRTVTHVSGLAPVYRSGFRSGDSASLHLLEGGRLLLAHSPAIRVLSNAMIEAMDTEFGRLLVETGLATRDSNGNLVYDPRASNTMIVIVGDNGSLAQTVKTPFRSYRAKSTVYQTGVWVPLIVAGPAVVQPGRAVNDMVNEVDIFQLFGELAGIDVHRSVPRAIDSHSMLPYLTNPNQPSIRKYNYTQGGLNIQKDGAHNGPCVFDGFDGARPTCSQTPVSQSVCEDNGGTWWGEGANEKETNGGDLDECWQVNQSIWEHDPAHYPTKKVDQSPQQGYAVRNDHYKLVKNQWEDYDIRINGPIPVTSIEFYRVNEREKFPRIDLEPFNLLQKPLNPVEQLNFNILQAKMNAITASAPPCPGDGNGDGVVDEKDVADMTGS